MKRSTIIDGISYLYIVLFLYTALSKITNYTVFKEQIAATPIFTKTAPFIAAALPISEVIVSVLLFRPKWRRIGLYTTLLLLVLFTAYIVYILTIDDKLPCSCGGIIEELSWRQHLVFNAIMIFLAFIGVYISNKTNSINQAGSNLLYN